MATPRIRKATETDLPAINAIYNRVVETSVFAFDTELRTGEQRLEWFRTHGKRHPVFVAEIDGAVAGWASLSAWSDRGGYDPTIEISFFVDENHRRHGIGEQLLRKVIDSARKLGFHVIIARIAEGNDVSIAMHEKAGFEHIGVMKEVGLKFGRRLDIILMQLILTDPKYKNT